MERIKKEEEVELQKKKDEEAKKLKESKPKEIQPTATIAKDDESIQIDTSSKPTDIKEPVSEPVAENTEFTEEEKA